MSGLPELVVKDADDSRTLTVNVTDLLVSGETVSGTPAWSVEGSHASESTPLTVGSAAYSSPNASAIIAAGTLRQVYTVRCRIVTSAGNQYDKVFTVRIGSAL